MPQWISLTGWKAIFLVVLIFIHSSYGFKRNNKPEQFRRPTVLVNPQPLPLAKGNQFNISIVTWNLNEKTPNSTDLDFITTLGEKSNAVVIGIQECENIKFRSKEGSRSRAWAILQKAALGPQFELICRHKVGGTQIAFFARSEFADCIEGVEAFDVICGVGNIVANKGAACIVIKFPTQSLGLISAHLTAQVNKVFESFVIVLFFTVLKSIGCGSECKSPVYMAQGSICLFTKVAFHIIQEVS